ncbi:MAG: PIN domain-containing protein, partial [Deferrisomatales bacterium]
MSWRVVFDTNVMISDVLWRGAPYQCLQLARGGVVEACYCAEMLDELSAKLVGKFGFSTERATQTL